MGKSYRLSAISTIQTYGFVIGETKGMSTTLNLQPSTPSDMYLRICNRETKGMVSLQLTTHNLQLTTYNLQLTTHNYKKRSEVDSNHFRKSCGPLPSNQPSDLIYYNSNNNRESMRIKVEIGN